MFVFLGCMECMRWRLTTDVSVSLSVTHFTWFWCAKTTEWIKVLFAMKTPGLLENLDEGSNPRTAREQRCAFNTTFAKLLWPLDKVYMYITVGKPVIIQTNISQRALL